ncbi:MAG: Trk system potassium transporter TrkA [Methanobacteriota archaeon]
MLVIVAGAGEVGLKVSQGLREEGHDVVLIDERDEALLRAARLDIGTVAGNCCAPRTLMEAGVTKAELFFAVTSKDEVNMLACSMAKPSGCRTVARINGPDYVDQAVTRKYAAIGVDVAICPELVAALKVGRLLDIPSVADIGVFAQGRVRLVETVVRSGSKASGKPLKDLKIPAGANVVAVLREAEIIVPSGSDRLFEGDRLLVIVQHEEDVSRLEKLMGTPAAVESDRKVRRVLVMGGTRLGEHVARILSEREKHVTLVEEDPARCKALAQELSGVTVVQGNATDKDVLIDEGIETADAVIGAAKLEEFNILSCLLSKSLGAKRAVAFVNQPDLKSLVERIGIDIAIDPRHAAVSEFLKYAHAKPPEEMTLLSEGEAQILEVEVPEKSRIAGTRLQRAGFPPQSVVGAIVRGEEVLVPRGDTVLASGDRLVVFVRADAVKALQRLLS